MNEIDSDKLTDDQFDACALAEAMRDRGGRFDMGDPSDTLEQRDTEECVDLLRRIGFIVRVQRDRMGRIVGVGLLEH